MKRPFVVGIAGGTCSGKSTLTNELANYLSNNHIVVINMDNYFKENPPMCIAPITKKEYPEHNHPDTLNLDDLYSDYEKAIKDTSVDFVLIEGLFALYLDRIREKLDLKVYVDLQSDERLVRRLRRFSTYGQSFDEISQRYLDTVRYRHDELVEPTRWHADIIINGTFDNKGIDLLINYLKSKR